MRYSNFAANNRLKNIFLSIIKSSFLIFLICLPFLSKANSSEGNIAEKNNISLNKQIVSSYVVDTSDIFYINFFGIDLFTGNYKVNKDGYLILPEIGLFFARGKTIPELRIEIEDKYKEFIDNPKIEIFLSNSRPINISLTGEVNRPGLYKFNNDQKKLIGSLNQDNFRYLFNDDQSPRLFDALQRGLGVNSNADLRNIIIFRNSPSSQGGGKIQAKVDILALLEDGDQEQNIILMDKDIINIPKSNTDQIDQLLSFSRSNISPDSIKVFINGFIENNGAIELKTGTSLFEGLAAAGGKSLSTGKIVFLRLKPNGKNEKRILDYDANEKKGSRNNPILLDGDIIYVRKNLIGKTSELIKEYTSPLINAYGVYKIFD